MDNNFLIITSFKNKWDYFNLFVNYYNKEWFCSNFYINFGYSSIDYLILFFEKLKIDKNDINNYLKSYKNFHYKLSLGDIEVIFYCYLTNEFGSPNEWNKTKNEIFNIADKKIDIKFNRILNIDSDEYLQTMDINSILNGEINEKVFHFVEYIPNRNIFSLDSDMNWCTQGWYYSIIGKGSSDIITNGNKLYYFNRSDIKNPWIHVNKMKNCKAEIEIYGDNDLEINDIINNNDICFHFSTPDEESLLYRFKNFKNGNGKFNGSHIPSNFDFYLDPSEYYPVFINNKLKKYF